MESEKLYRELIKSSEKIENIIWAYHTSGDINGLNFEVQFEFENNIRAYKKLFLKMIEQSSKDNFYWQYCCSDVYKAHYKERLKQYFDKYPDSIEKDFIQDEIDYLNKREASIKYEDKVRVFDADHNQRIELELFFLSSNEFKSICQSQERKIEFLQNKLKKVEVNESIDSNTIQELLDCFESESKYKKVMEILAVNGFIHPNTYIYKDDKKRNKSILAALIKDLHSKGYYKMPKRPQNKEIESICKNTFQWEVGIDTIKKAKPDNFDFSFIPIASTLE